VQQLRKARLGVVVACSNSKRLTPLVGLSLRELHPGPRRASTWAARVDRAHPRLPLFRLYKGAHWQSCLDLRARADVRMPTDLWVMSAGLGLQSATALAPGYRATFGTGPDSVGPTVQTHREWWGALSRRPQRHRLSDLAQRYDELLIVLAPAYLQVLAPELRAVEGGSVAVVSSVEVPGLPVQSSAGLVGVLGGSAQTLNPRAAAQYLELAGRSRLGSGAAAQRWETWAASRRATTTYDRERLDDDAVRRLIRAEGAEGPGSATALLRHLRDRGFACEQARFAALYREVMVR
jgi:hypothetical protein